MTRDMTRRQFDDACESHGFKPQGFMGYYDIGGCCVSVLNAGPNRRARLAYLIAQRRREEERRAAPRLTADGTRAIVVTSQQRTGTTLGSQT